MPPRDQASAPFKATPLTSAQANALVDTLSIWRDDPAGARPGKLDGADVLVAEIPDLTLVAGVQTVAFADGDPQVQVAWGTPRTYFVVVRQRADASAQTPSDFLLTHVTESGGTTASSTAEDRDHDVPLALEKSPNVTATTQAQADLALTKEASSLTVAAGGVLTYTLTVTNDGPSTAEDVVIVESLPPEVAAAVTSGCAEDPTGTPACSLGDLAAGASAQVLIAATIDTLASPGLLINTATVSAVGGDPDPADNTATLESLLGLFGPTDLALTKDDDLAGAPALTGSGFSYVLTLSNFGPKSSSGGRLVDPLPAGLTFGGSADGCFATADTVSCPFGAVAVGHSVTARFEVDVAGDAEVGEIVNTASILANERDLVLGNNAATLVTPLADGIAPRVSASDALPGGAVDNCSEVRLAPAGFAVRFDEEVFDPPGDADPDDVTNPANYRLLATGDDHGFSTRDCGPLQGDDVPLAFTVSYAAATSTATLSRIDTLPLADGVYRLMVCGSTTLRDLGGNALDGRRNGRPGDDWVRTFRVETVNQLAGGHFDCDVAAFVDEPPDAAAFSTKDADAANVSGSARATNPGADFALAQCVEIAPVPESHNYVVAARLLLDAAPGVTVDVSRFCEAYAAAECTDAVLGSEGGLDTLGETAGGWLDFEDLANLPPAAVSALCVFRVEAPGAPPFTAFLDDLHFGAETPLFTDGFESGDTRFWVIKQ